MLAERITDILRPDELATVRLAREQFGIDIPRTYQFWEFAVARLTTGSLTGHKCPWDVELEYISGPLRIEVKYAQETWCQFSSGRRAIFKFADPRGRGKDKGAHVIILIGIDEAGDIHSWVIPGRLVRKCRSITLTSPRFRIGASRSRGIDSYRCPLTQLLPEVLRAYREHVKHDCRRHLHYDREHHAETRALTRHRQQEEAGQGLLFGEAS